MIANPAERLLQRGTSRLWYQARELATSKQVTAILVQPNLKQINVSLEEFGYGLYYFEFDFKSIGDYTAIFFEDGELVGSCFVRVAL